MKQRHLGGQGLVVSELGLGCGTIYGLYGPTDEAECVATIQRAVDLGVTLFDTAAAYGLDPSGALGPSANERVVGRALRGRRDQVSIATKFGVEIGTDGVVRGLNSRPERVKAEAEASLRALGVEVIDLYQQHRLDPQTPIEETVGALADLVREGKVRFIGLCEVGAETLRRAHTVHPVTSVQSEYSLWERSVEWEVLPTCRELNVGFIPFSPLGRGFLTGRVRRAEDYDPADFRHTDPRYRSENFDQNTRILRALEDTAAAYAATPGQIALAWLLRQGEDVVPIPGTKRRAYLEENVAATAIRLQDADVVRLAKLFPPGSTAGPRYRQESIALVQNT